MSSPPADKALKEPSESSCEVAIIRRVLDGEKDEFRHLVERYQDRIFAVIMRQVGEETLARELTQDTFLKAYTGLPGFKQRSQFSTWLTRIAINVTNSHFASRRHSEEQRSSPLEDSEQDQIATPESLSQSSLHELKQLKEKIFNFLKTLKPQHREVLSLVIFEECTHQEAAAILGIPMGTVSTRTNAALNLLRKHLRKDIGR